MMRVGSWVAKVPLQAMTLGRLLNPPPILRVRAIRHQIPQLVKRSHHRTICSGGLGPASGNPLLGRGGPTATLSVQLFPRTGDTRPSRDGSLDVGSSSLQSLNLGQGLVRKVPPLPRIGSFMPLVDLGRPRVRTRRAPRVRSIGRGEDGRFSGPRVRSAFSGAL